MLIHAKDFLRFSAFGAIAAVVALAPMSARAQNTITLNIANSPDLLNAFAKAASGFAPRLKLTGIQIQNGSAGFGEAGGGLYVEKAGRV